MAEYVRGDSERVPDHSLCRKASAIHAGFDRLDDDVGNRCWNATLDGVRLGHGEMLWDSQRSVAVSTH
jgi:hypothetical protein